MTLNDIDLAAVCNCPNCGQPTRHMGGVPVAGSGLDLVFADTVWCWPCLQAKCVAAADEVRARRPGSTIARTSANPTVTRAGDTGAGVRGAVETHPPIGAAPSDRPRQAHSAAPISSPP